MNIDCKTIKSWILTDYLDGELDTNRQKALERHIKGCRACAALLDEAKTSLVEPFEKIERPMPNKEFLWHRIKSKIEKQPDTSFGGSVLERILLGLKAPKPIFALSTCAALIVAIFVVTQANSLYQKEYLQRSATASLEEQIDYFASDETASFGTDTNGYFL